MARLAGWRTRLAAVVQDAMRRPFAWGTSDCCTGLAFPAIQAVTGQDLSGPYTGQYTSPIGALKALLTQGHAGIIELFHAHFEECPPALARVGDLVAIEQEGDWAMGVVIGARAGFLRPDGFGTVDILKCDRAFRVG